MMPLEHLTAAVPFICLSMHAPVLGGQELKWDTEEDLEFQFCFFPFA